MQKLTKQILELQFSIKCSAAHSATKFKKNSRNSRKIQGIQRKIVNSVTLFGTLKNSRSFKGIQTIQGPLCRPVRGIGSPP